jgi:tetratricopeptide (TPR) repeat protein
MFRNLLAALLLLAPGTAHAAWHEASGAHFVVYSDDRPERLKDFATKLERFDKALRWVLNVPDQAPGPNNRLTVYVVSNVREIQQLAGNQRIAGFYQARASGSVAFVPRRAGDDDAPEAILLHEYAHHFMFNNWPESAFPKWLVEGWAEFYGATNLTRQNVELGVVPYGRGPSILEGNWLPADKLLVAETLKLNEQQFAGLYGRGWLLTHYLINGGKRPGQLAAYIRAINEGKNLVEAAKVFGDLAVLDRELERYKRGAITYHRLANTALTVGEVTMRQLTPGEAATMDVRIKSKRGVNSETAPGIYAEAKKAAAPFPGDAGAQLMLAEAAFDAGDHAAAEAAADRAIAANPKLVDAHLYKARAKMELMTKKGDLTKESWAAVRRSIIAANRLDPEDPEPLIDYYRSFFEAGERPSKQALAGFFYAADLAPHDLGLRMNAAYAYVADGKPDRAKALLRPIAFSPHGGGMSQAAAKLIADIDSGKALRPDADAEAEEEKAAEAN